MDGYLLLIYKRDVADPERINGLNMVFKGTWRLTNDEQKMDFIYKRVAKAENEMLLTEYFCNVPQQKLIDTSTDLSRLNVNRYSHFYDLFIASQGRYEGFFNYDDRQINESFSYILRRP